MALEKYLRSYFLILKVEAEKEPGREDQNSDLAPTQKAEEGHACD